jgi:hypothetical protein
MSREKMMAEIRGTFVSVLRNVFIQSRFDRTR